MTDDLDTFAQGVPESPLFTFLRVGFDLGNTSVPFFSTTLAASQLRDFLKLPSDLPVDPQRPIEIEELFQRDLDEDRVRDRIVPYLEAPNKLRFFNALTVVLLPLDPASRRLAANYDQPPALAPPGVPGRTQVTVGPITFSYNGENRKIGQMRWNTDLTAPIVLDGQHRYRAMDIVMSRVGALGQDMRKSEVSVLFLVLDPAAGFKPATDISVLGACRQIFIDLNQYAKGMSRARMALLNDRDVTSMALRSVIAEAVEVDAAPVADRVAETGRLPLTLVGWRATDILQGESAKFDTGPYVTSLLTLQDVVDYILGAGKFVDPTDHARALTFVQNLAGRLDLADDPRFNLKRREREIAAAEDAERPFDLDPAAVTAAGEAFGERFRRRISEPLTQLTPYRVLIDRLTDAGVLGTGLEPWLAFNRGEREALLKDIQAEADPDVEVRAAWEGVKNDEYPLAFQVVFQKAFLFSLNSACNNVSAVGELWKLDPIDEDAVRAEWIRRFNLVMARSTRVTGTESPFYGAGIRSDGTIDFRKTRIGTITGFVTYCMLADMPAWIGQAQAGALPEQAIGEWLSESWAKIQPGRRGPLDALFSLHGKTWRQGVDELVRQTAGTEEDDDGYLHDSAVHAHATEQLLRVVRLAAAV